MERLAPWQRNMIALAHGILLKASGNMKWMANVDVLAARAEDAFNYSLFPIEADLEMEAAQEAARSVARALYGDDGEIGFVAPSIDPNRYVATCGLYQGNGLTRGRSLAIHIQEYRGVQ
jgi:hypothetical protein